jgi:hypothetical protein
MSALCHVVDKGYNAIVAIVIGWQVGYEVDANSLPTALGYRQWLQEAPGFATPVVGSMEQVAASHV